jgi:hypothetical protein
MWQLLESKNSNALPGSMPFSREPLVQQTFGQPRKMRLAFSIKRYVSQVVLEQMGFDQKIRNHLRHFETIF